MTCVRERGDDPVALVDAIQLHSGFQTNDLGKVADNWSNWAGDSVIGNVIDDEIGYIIDQWD